MEISDMFALRIAYIIARSSAISTLDAEVACANH
jgi:hypothetical protein